MLAAALPLSGEAPRQEATRPVKELELRGRVVCLAEEMHRLHQAELPTRHEHLWSLQTEDGSCYVLLRGKYSEAIFLDERVRRKELAVKARLFPGTQVIEVTNLHSIKNGVVQDLYYYCDVCAIQAVSPEPCSCCQGPVKLVEKPMADRKE